MVLSTETRSYFSFWFYQGNASWPMIYFFNHVIGQTKKKVNILRNIIQELKANTWNKREARENAGDLVEICFSFVKKMALFFFQTNHISRPSNNNAIPNHFSLPIGKLLHL